MSRALCACFAADSLPCFQPKTMLPCFPPKTKLSSSTSTVSLLRPLLLLQRVRERCARVSLLTGPVQTTDPIGADDSTLRLELDTATLKIGDSVEIRWEGDWWYLASFQPVGSLVTCSQVFQFLTVSVCGREAEILNIDLNQNQIQVHYVGGSDEEDEWVPCDGHRVQLPPLLQKELSTKREEGKQRGRERKKREREKERELKEDPWAPRTRR